MDDFLLIQSFLQNYGIDVIVLGVLVCIFTGLVKKFIPKSLKSVNSLLPFLFGLIFYGLFSLLLSKSIITYEIVNKGVQTGAIATLIYAFAKQIRFSGGSFYNSVSELLTGILSSKTISEVVKVIKEHCHSTATEEEKLKRISEVLNENEEIPEDIKDVVIKLILQTLSQNKK